MLSELDDAASACSALAGVLLDNFGAGGPDESEADRTVGGESGYTVAALREMTGLENTALNRYAKSAGVKTPSRGQRNFRYSSADVRRILETIITQTSEDRVLAKCRESLRNLQEIPE